MDKEKKEMYYLNKECEIIHKIDKYETLIKISLDVFCSDEDSEYNEYSNEDYHLIVNNKYLFDKPCEVNEEIEKIEQVYRNKEEKLNKNHNELIDKQCDEISKLENKKKYLFDKYKKVKGIETALDLMFGDYKYIVSLGWSHYKIIKKEDLENDFEELENLFKCTVIEERVECSYNGYDCTIAKNYEEALKILKEYMELKASDSYVNSYINKACKKYNIDIKGLSKYRKEQKEKLKEGIAKKKLQYKKEIEELEEKLKNNNN